MPYGTPLHPPILKQKIRKIPTIEVDSLTGKRETQQQLHFGQRSFHNFSRSSVRQRPQLLPLLNRAQTGSKPHPRRGEHRVSSGGISCAPRLADRPECAKRSSSRSVASATSDIVDSLDVETTLQGQIEEDLPRCQGFTGLPNIQDERRPPRVVDCEERLPGAAFLQDFRKKKQGAAVWYNDFLDKVLCDGSYTPCALRNPL